MALDMELDASHSGGDFPKTSCELCVGALKVARPGAPPLFLVSDGDLYQRLEEDMLALWLVPVAETRALYPPLRAGVVCRPS
jgi:hypothetical protein